MTEKKWDGKERRMSIEDHDILLKIDANLDYFIKQFDEHKKEDDKRFDKLDKRTSWIEKLCYGLAGVVAFFDIFWKK